MFDLGQEEQVELVFREQADGRKVARLPSGKIALVHYDGLEEVENGERWLVNLVHRETFAVAYPLHKTEDAPPQPVRAQPRTNVLRPETETPDTLPFQRAPVAEPKLDVSPPPPATTNGVTRTVPVEAPVEPADVIRETDRVAFFVDAANLDQACRDAGYFIDFGKAVQHFRGRGVLYGAYYYVADFTVERDSKQVSFLDYLNHAGYVVRLKKVKRIIDRDSGNEIFKANVDTEIVVDMLNTADNFDVAYLFSGDSDFERLVDILRSRGKRVYVVSSRQSLSRELAFVADKPIHFVEDHRDVLVRE